MQGLDPAAIVGRDEGVDDDRGEQGAEDEQGPEAQQPALRRSYLQSVGVVDHGPSADPPRARG
jgi:hypothetical protein